MSRRSQRVLCSWGLRMQPGKEGHLLDRPVRTSLNTGRTRAPVAHGFRAAVADQQSRDVQVRTRETAAMAGTVHQIIAQIEEATVEIRRLMAERYKINL
ncbi:MAG TPA: hypothetical protein EYH34_10365 [Planctomycetes bacterium]|nr:hypothetical protein [Planctomycetota bacterium]